MSAAEYGRKAAVLEQFCEEAGRDPTSITYTWECSLVAIARDEPEARRIAESSLMYQNNRPDGALIGTPDTIVSKMQEYIAVGVRHFILRFLDFPRSDGALLFASEVAPRLRALMR